LSGGADSTALVVLAVAAGCVVTAHHVDHGVRADSGADAALARATAAALGVDFVLHEVEIAAGPNQEARLRRARYDTLPAGVLTGHTADDQAETVLLNLLRGAGLDGLSAMSPGPTKPLLALRRHDTLAVCRSLALTVAVDPTNGDRTFRRNRIRHEALPLLADIAQRDPVDVLARTADVLRQDLDLLDRLAADLDPTDARQLTAAHPALASRAVRRWLAADGYAPDSATVDRVLAVATGARLACELTGGRRVERSGQRLRVVAPAR
jgi:tRNA(Ile)-lysidine synthase